MTAGTVDVVGLIDRVRMSALQLRVFMLCALVSLADGYDIQALGLVVPGMARAFGLPPTAFTPALTSSLVGMAIGAMLLAPLADRFGRRRAIIALLLLIAATTLGATRSAGPIELAAWRFLTGLGMGAVAPVAIAMTAEYAPARRRAAIVTMMIVCMPLGSFAAGIVAARVEAIHGWQGVFASGALLPLAVALLIWAALPESLQFLLGRDPDGPAAARQLQQLDPAAAALRPVMPARAIGSAASVASLFRREFRARTIVLWAICWFNLFVVYSLISWLPTLLVSSGWERAAAQRATGVLALGGMGGGLLLAWLADRGHAAKALAFAYVVAALLLAAFLLEPERHAIWLGLLALVGASGIGAQMALGSLSASFYPADIRATGLGWSGGIGRLGAISGPLVLSALIGAGFTAGPVLTLLMVPMLVCAALVSLLPRALRSAAPRC